MTGLSKVTPNNMQNKIPLFQFNPGQAYNRYAAFIEADGTIIHKISNLDEFYSAFGYTKDMGLRGVMPSEFMWEEYVKGSTLKSTVCKQARIIGYLKKHSEKFINRYGNQCENWLAAYEKVIAASDMACFACRTNSCCEIKKSS